MSVRGLGVIGLLLAVASPFVFVRSVDRGEMSAPGWVLFGAAAIVVAAWALGALRPVDDSGRTVMIASDLLPTCAVAAAGLVGTHIQLETVATMIAVLLVSAVMTRWAMSAAWRGSVASRLVGASVLAAAAFYRFGITVDVAASLVIWIGGIGAVAIVLGLALSRFDLIGRATTRAQSLDTRR